MNGDAGPQSTEPTITGESVPGSGESVPAGPGRFAPGSPADDDHGFDHLFYGVDDPVFVTEPRGGAILDANPAAQTRYRYAIDQLRTKTLAQLAISDPALNQAYADAVHISASGERFPVQIRSAPVAIDDRHCVIHIVRDMTGRSIAQSRLRALSELDVERQTAADLYRITGERMIQVGLHVACLELDEDRAATMQYASFDAGAYGLVSTTAADTQPQPPHQPRPVARTDEPTVDRVVRHRETIFVANATAVLSALLPRAAASDPSEPTLANTVIVCPLLTAGKTTGLMLCAGETLAIEDIPSVELIARQLSLTLGRLNYQHATEAAYNDLKEAQDALIRSERLAAIGELAAALSHEIRNPLSAIANAIGDVRDAELAIPNPQRRQLDVAGEAVEKLDKLVEDFLSFARPRPRTPEVSNVQRLIGDTLLLFRNHAEYRHEIALETTVEKDAAGALVDTDLLPEMLLNLLLNSAQAISGAGRISIAARAAMLEQQPAVAIAVTDTGSGISAEDLRRVFQPFYTSKKQGAGLGLAIVERIIGEHAGTVDITSRVGAGTTVLLTLPREPHEGH